MVKKIIQRSTYTLSLHDLKDDLRINAVRILEVTLIVSEAAFDDPIIRIVVDEEIEAEED